MLLCAIKRALYVLMLCTYIGLTIEVKSKFVSTYEYQGTILGKLKGSGTVFTVMGMFLNEGRGCRTGKGTGGGGGGEWGGTSQKRVKTTKKGVDK